jgi:hypothetical protein
MLKKTILSGVTGGIAMSLWTFVANGLLGFASKTNMKALPNEPQVYELLKSSVVEPGRYVVNPPPVEPIGYPSDEPVFGLLFSGVGHESAGILMCVELLVMFGATILVAWMLSRTGAPYRASYMRRVLFFTVAGILLALSVDLDSFGIAGRPLADAILLGTHRIAMWTFVGLVAGWFMKTEADEAIS